jgi:hypothetical protein
MDCGGGKGYGVSPQFTSWRGGQTPIWRAQERSPPRVLRSRRLLGSKCETSKSSRMAGEGVVAERFRWRGVLERGMTRAEIER